MQTSHPPPLTQGPTGPPAPQGYRSVLEIPLSISYKSALLPAHAPDSPDTPQLRRFLPTIPLCLLSTIHSKPTTTPKAPPLPLAPYHTHYPRVTATNTQRPRTTPTTIDRVWRHLVSQCIALTRIMRRSTKPRERAGLGVGAEGESRVGVGLEVFLRAPPNHPRGAVLPAAAHRV